MMVQIPQATETLLGELRALQRRWRHEPRAVLALEQAIAIVREQLADGRELAR